MKKIFGIIAIIVLCGFCWFLFNMLSDGKGSTMVKIANHKLDQTLAENYSVEMYDVKINELKNTYVNLIKRINLMEAKINAYTDKISDLNSIVPQDIKTKNKVETYQKIIDSMKSANIKLVALKNKIAKTLEQHKYQREILKNKTVLVNSLKDVNGYLKDFNIDGGIDSDNINNLIDESIIEEEAELQAYDILSE